MKPIDITFFVPCLNEEKNVHGTLDTLFEAVRAFPYRCEILVVDDGSIDNTLQVLKGCEKNSPIPITIIHNPKTKGIGYNYWNGALKARGTYYMTINGDNVEPVEAIQMILSQLGNADMIIPFHRKTDKRSRKRKILSRVFIKIVNCISGNSIRYYNGIVLHRTENVRSAGLKTTGFGYQAELICKLLQKGKTYVEVEPASDVRRWGSSKAFSLANFFSIGSSLFQIFLRRLRKSVLYFGFGDG